MRSNLRKRNPPKESTQTPLEPYTLRHVRTCVDEPHENLGMYLVLECVDGDQRVDGYDRWHYIPLVADSDIDSDVEGCVNEATYQWLVDWTEPWEE